MVCTHYPYNYVSGTDGPQVISRVSTSAILTGLENLPLKEKALKKATELQKKATKAEKNLQVGLSLQIGYIRMAASK